MIRETLITLAIIIVAFLLFYQFWFLRDPQRTIPKRGVVSPADGKISRIIKIKKNTITIEKGLVGKIRTQTKDTIEEGYLINIVMTPLDVHYQRAPMDGDVLSVKHIDGSFRNAVLGSHKFNALENERTEILLKTRKGKMKVIQIAGFLARRIVPFVEKGSKIKKGQHIGLIKLGSQVSLIIPTMDLKVEEGQRVTGGETVIAQ